MRKLMILLLCMLFMTGCTSAQQAEPTMAPVIPVTEEEAVIASEVIDLISVCIPATEETYFAEDGTQLYSYIGQHLEITHADAELADKIILDFLNRVDVVLPEAESVYKDALTAYDTTENWYPYYYHILYNPTRIDRDVLSFMGTRSSYNGGMHSSICVVSANYDMITGDVLTWGSIMHETAQKDDFIEVILKKLDEIQDEYYLFDDYRDIAVERLAADENQYEDFFFTTTGLNFYFSPYEIAPYSSGIITVEIPYHELPGLLHDSYFPAERDVIHGNMHFSFSSDLDMDQFHSMTEVVLSDTGEMVMIYPEGTVEDIRITVAGDGMSIPDYTVFASQAMSDGDAIVLNIEKEDLHKISVHYYSNNLNEQLSITE